MSSKDPICVNDFHVHAKERLPKVWFDYQDGGADDEQTLDDNVKAFQRVRLRPRVLRDVSQRDLSTSLLGTPVSCPIAIASTGYHQMCHPQGEIATAKGAASSGTCMILSSHGSNTHLCDVRSLVPSSTVLWILIYIYNERSITQNIVQMAEKAGYRAVVLTVDAPITGKKIRDIRNGLANMAYTEFHLPKHLRLPNIELQEGKDVARKVDFDMSVTWSVIDWLHSITSLPIVIKGILTAEDTREALKHNVAGIIVSNHGGRQLDGVPATIDALPEVVDAASGSDVEIYIDGGIRNGTDVLKALALGAKAVFIGRPILWGLAYNGEHGVKQVLDILKEECSLAMALSGCCRITDITRDLVKLPSSL